MMGKYYINVTFSYQLWKHTVYQHYATSIRIASELWTPYCVAKPYRLIIFKPKEAHLEGKSFRVITNYRWNREQIQGNSFNGRPVDSGRFTTSRNKESRHSTRLQFDRGDWGAIRGNSSNSGLVWFTNTNWCSIAIPPRQVGPNNPVRAAHAEPFSSLISCWALHSSTRP